MTPLAVFLSSFISVFALGFQSQNVNQGHYVAAFITSFAIGGGTLVLYKVLPDGTWLDTVAYLIGGAPASLNEPPKPAKKSSKKKS